MNPRPLTNRERDHFDLFHALMQDFTLRERWGWPLVALLARTWLARYDASHPLDRDRGVLGS